MMVNLKLQLLIHLDNIWNMQHLNIVKESHSGRRVAVTKEDLIYQQATLDREAEQEGLRRRKFTDPFLERTVIQEKIAEKLLERDTLLLHGSTVAVDGQAYLFTAPCRTGISTHTRL
mgnify:CR=1 FL=1